MRKHDKPAPPRVLRLMKAVEPRLDRQWSRRLSRPPRWSAPSDAQQVRQKAWRNLAYRGKEWSQSLGVAPKNERDEDIRQTPIVPNIVTGNNSPTESVGTNEDLMHAVVFRWQIGRAGVVATTDMRANAHSADCRSVTIAWLSRYYRLW